METGQLWDMPLVITEVRLAWTLYVLLVVHMVCIDHWMPSYARMRSTYCRSAPHPLPIGTPETTPSEFVLLGDIGD